MPHAIGNANEPLPASLTSAVVCAAALGGFKPYLLSEKSAPVAELFLNRYELNATKASTQLRKIESIGAFVPGSTPLWKEGGEPAPYSIQGHIGEGRYPGCPHQAAFTEAP